MGLVKYTILAITILYCISYAGEKIAIVTKIIGKAEYERGKNSSKILTKGFIIENGDRISTPKGGFVALIFIDDKSALKIREKTKIIINGKKSSSKISKKIDLSSGTIRAQVENNRDFIVQTSVSVASVKGTDFWVISDSKIGDSVIGLEGIVSLSNRKSGEKIDIKYDEIDFARLISKNSKVQVITIKNEEDLRKFFIKNLISNELILCMGAGSISKWIREMTL